MSLPFEIQERQDEIRREVEALGAELLEIQFRRSGSRGILTFIVDKESGVSLDDCAAINRRIGQWLDELGDFFQGSYFLEVNSPGLDRPLRTRRDFERAKGDVIHLVYRDDAGKSRDYVGELREVTDDDELVFVKPNGEQLFQVKIDAVFKGTRQIHFGNRS